LYADDCDISDCIHRPNIDLEAIFRWSVENGLSLNSGKTQAMIICRDRGRLPAVLVDGRTLAVGPPFNTTHRSTSFFVQDTNDWNNVSPANVRFVQKVEFSHLPYFPAMKVLYLLYIN
jgi:hypothetical protein